MINWVRLEQLYQALNQELVTPNLDPKKRIELQKKSSRYREFLDLNNEIAAAQKFLDENKQQEVQ